MRELLAGLALGAVAWVIYQERVKPQIAPVTENRGLELVDLDSIPMRRRVASVLDIARGVAIPGEILEY